MMINSEAMVSVIIPTYQSGKYIHRCLTALDMQVYKDFEVIIVDAGSTDCTLEIIEKFKSKLKIKCLILEKSTQSEARNLGILNASGSYLAFCDSDDFYLPEKIAKQIATMEMEDVDVCYFDVLHFYTGQEDKFFVNQHPQNTDILAECIAHQTINLNAVMVKKRFLEQKKILFPTGELGRYGEDGYFIFQLALHQGCFKKLNESLSVVEVRLDSHTQWDLQWKMKYYRMEYLSAAYQQLDKKYHVLCNNRLKDLQFKLAISYILAGQYDKAQLLLKSLATGFKAILLRVVFFMLRILPKRQTIAMIKYLWVVIRSKQLHFNVDLQPAVKKMIDAILSSGAFLQHI